MMKDLTLDKDVTSSLPLVSVVVVTYNSSVTVIETLDSIKSQTYKNIELIVTDDCSHDNTIGIVKQWLEENDSRFVDVQLVISKKNTGVSGNINRGIYSSHGEWIKTIAGDDMLIPVAIEEYVMYIFNHPENVRMCVCDVEPFSEDGEVPENISVSYKRLFERESENYDLQRKRVMTSLVFVGPAYFFSKELFDEIGGCSEKYGCAEEWPFVYKIIRGGNRIYALNKKLVRYRVQLSSLCRTKDNGGLINKRVFDGMYMFFFDHPFKDLISEGHLLLAWHYALLYWARNIQYNIKCQTLGLIIMKFLLFFSPLVYLKKLKIVEQFD